MRDISFSGQFKTSLVRADETDFPLPAPRAIALFLCAFGDKRQLSGERYHAAGVL